MQWSLFVVGVVIAAGVAGCNEPAPMPQPSFTPAPPPPLYEVRFVVTQETPDGAPLPGEVAVVPILESGALGPMQVQGTNAGGVARFVFQWPTTLLVRASAPGDWTKEGGRVHVDQAVAAAGLLVSDRDVFLPLFRSTLPIATTVAWSTTTAQPMGLGTSPATTFQPLAFPEGLQAAYLARLADATIVVTWMDSMQGHVATLSTGLAWNGQVWTEGPEASAAATGSRTAAWDGDLPRDGWPADLEAAQLQVALLTRTAIVGDVLFAVSGALQFGGHAPAELPSDDCHLLCGPTSA